MTTPTVITTDMGPCHVGSLDSDSPTVMGYISLGVAMDRQRAFIRRGAEQGELARGYGTRFYLDLDGAVTPVGRLVFRGWDTDALGADGPPTREPIIDWEYEAGFCGPVDVADGLAAAAPTEMLLRLAGDGDEDAAAELERRGVSGCVVSLTPAQHAAAQALGDLDMARERHPNPGWLRQFASTLRTEAGMLEGHLATAIEDLARCRSDETNERVGRTMLIAGAQAALEVAAERLGSLADDLDRRPPAGRPGPFAGVLRRIDEARVAAHDDARGEADGPCLDTRSRTAPHGDPARAEGSRR